MQIINWIRFLLSAGFLGIGLFILSASVFGVYKFKYVLNRMHSAAMGDTLGILFCLLGVVVSADDATLIAKLLLTILFLWTASPVSSHLIARLEVNTNPVWERELIAAHEFVNEGENSDGLL